MRKQERLYISQKQAEQEKTCRPLLKCHSLQRKIKDFDEKAKIKEENMESDIDVYRFSSEGTPAQSNVSCSTSLETRPTLKLLNINCVINI